MVGYSPSFSPTPLHRAGRRAARAPAAGRGVHQSDLARSAGRGDDELGAAGGRGVVGLPDDGVGAALGEDALEVGVHGVVLRAHERRWRAFACQATFVGDCPPCSRGAAGEAPHRRGGGLRRATRCRRAPSRPRRRSWPEPSSSIVMWSPKSGRPEGRGRGPGVVEHRRHHRLALVEVHGRQVDEVGDGRVQAGFGDDRAAAGWPGPAPPGRPRRWPARSSAAGHPGGVAVEVGERPGVVAVARQVDGVGRDPSARRPSTRVPTPGAVPRPVHQHHPCAHAPDARRWRCGRLAVVRVHLVDGTYELFRYFFALPAHVNGDGQDVAAARVVGSMLQLLEDGATHVGIATDHVIESFRNDLWATYKDGSGVDPVLFAQFPCWRRALEAAGFTVWAMGSEADGALGGRPWPRPTRGSSRCSSARPTRTSASASPTTPASSRYDRRKRQPVDRAGVIEKFGVPPESIPRLPRWWATAPTASPACRAGGQVGCRGAGPLRPPRGHPGGGGPVGTSPCGVAPSPPPCSTSTRRRCSSGASPPSRSTPGVRLGRRLEWMGPSPRFAEICARLDSPGFLTGRTNFAARLG